MMMMMMMMTTTILDTRKVDREGEERSAAELCSKRDAVLQPCRSMLWPGNRGSFTPQWRPRGGSSRRCGRIKRAEFRLRPMLKTKFLFFEALRFASHLAVFAGFVLVWPAGFLARPHSVLNGFVFSRCFVAPPRPVSALLHERRFLGATWWLLARVYLGSSLHVGFDPPCAEPASSTSRFRDQGRTLFDRSRVILFDMS